jgi:hypothetical protein
MPDETTSSSPVEAPSAARRLPYGGQMLLVMIAHSLFVDLTSESLTVTQFFPEDPELMATLAVVGPVANVSTLLAGIAFWLLGWRRAFRWLVGLQLVMATFLVLADCTNLVSTLTERASNTEAAFDLLWDAVLTWGSNVLTFGLWYWFLDQGGPDRRNSPEPERSDIAFPQQTAEMPGWEGWRPGLIDYLFVSFNTSLAFSPTDTVVLSIRAKILTMMQAGVAIIIVAMLAARVVNTIQ